MRHQSDFNLDGALAQTKVYLDACRNGPNGHPLTPKFHQTDMGNAERLLERHGKDILYVDPWGKWVCWDQRRYKIDAEQLVRRYAKETVRAIYKEAALLMTNAADIEDEEARHKCLAQARSLSTHARRSESSSRVHAMVSLAQMDVCVLPEVLDADPWVLNVQNGTLDLRTGQLRCHMREDLITKLCPISYNPQATCPIWEAFLKRVLQDDELLWFVQRAVGYSLTGDTSEQCLFLLHGTGANGKSTFLEIIRTLLGDYAEQADFNSFLHRDKETVRNDLAKLRSARFVAAIEADEGKRLAESLVKSLTGGDTITARFLFKEYFDFRPQFKLWLAANHKPLIRGTDNAIWRRIRLIPFAVTVPESEQDPTLPVKLKEELPGILNWALTGCRAWQADGRLVAPDIVKHAVQNYRTEMDVLGAFFEECCVLSPQMTTPADALYDAYKKWCEQSNEFAVTQTAFGNKLRERGLNKERSSATGRIIWRGIGLKVTAKEES